MAPSTGSPGRRLALWCGSVASGALLLWLASRRMPLWPEPLQLPRPTWLVLAILLHPLYAIVRAGRLVTVLGRPRGGPTIVPPALLYGSGLVSFFVVQLLPFRLGELSRPLLLARARLPGLGLAEALAAVAIERVADGIIVCGLLFFGLALAEVPPAGVAAAVPVEVFGRAMAVVFSLALLVLILAAVAPARAGTIAGRMGSPFGATLSERIGRGVARAAATVAAVGSLAVGLRFTLWSAAYWSITILQLYLVLHATGIELGPAAAAAIVAIVGLSIQLPAGPAQTGSFQVGTQAALSLYLSELELASRGSAFTAVMFLLQLGGTAVMAAVGAWLLARGRRADPTVVDPHGGP